MKYDLIAMGEMLMRLSPPLKSEISHNPVFERYFGGAEMNVAAAAAALGLKTAVVTKLPENLLGDLARQFLRNAGIDDCLVIADPELHSRLGLYYYLPADYPALPRVIYDREHTSMRSLQPGELLVKMYHNARCFHVSGITLGLGGSCRESAIEAIKQFKAAGAWISFDVNYRMNLWSGEEARQCIEQILPLVDIFFCSEDTMRLTFKKEGALKDMMASFAAQYPLKLIAAARRTVHRPSCHSFGCAVFNCADGSYTENSGYEQVEVTDRIGSGDAFVGGFLAGLLPRAFAENGVRGKMAITRPWIWAMPARRLK